MAQILPKELYHDPLASFSQKFQSPHLGAHSNFAPSLPHHLPDSSSYLVRPDQFVHVASSNRDHPTVITPSPAIDMSPREPLPKRDSHLNEQTSPSHSPVNGQITPTDDTHNLHSTNAMPLDSASIGTPGMNFLGDHSGPVPLEHPLYQSPSVAARSATAPIMGIVNSFADMGIGAPIHYATPMPIMPMQPHVMPIVPPQHVSQVSPRQIASQAIISNQRTTACHWVPQDRVGAVIGSHGAVIRNLQEKSGSTIQVHNETVRGDMKLFTIFGFPSQIEIAVQLIEQVIGRTRQVHSEGPDESSPFPPHFQRPNELFRTIYVPTSRVGLVIGRSGDTIRSLQDQSGADIKVTPDQHVQPGQLNRSIMLTGTEQAISIAQRLITEIVVDASRRNPHPSHTVGNHINGEVVVMVMIHVPNDKVGLIIGKKGVAIRDLQVRSGARIQVTKDGSSIQPDGTRPIMVTGVRSQVEEARKLIESKINAQHLLSEPGGPVVNGMGAMPPSINPTVSTPENGIDDAFRARNVVEADGGRIAANAGRPDEPHTPFSFGGSGYEQELGNTQYGFQAAFNGQDNVSHGRHPVPFMQYVGFNNYGGDISTEGRSMLPTLPMGYIPPHQQTHQDAFQQPQHEVVRHSTIGQQYPSPHYRQQYSQKPKHETDDLGEGTGANLHQAYSADTVDGNRKLMFGVYDSSSLLQPGREQSAASSQDEQILSTKRTENVSRNVVRSQGNLSPSVSNGSGNIANNTVNPGKSLQISERNHVTTGNGVSNESENSRAQGGREAVYAVAERESSRLSSNG